MTVYVVWTEWNRGDDLEGGGQTDGVALTMRGARRLAAETSREHRQFGKIRYGSALSKRHDEDWNFDVHIDSHEAVDAITRGDCRRCGGTGVVGRRSRCRQCKGTTIVR